MDEDVIRQRATPVLTDIFILYGEESLSAERKGVVVEYFEESGN